MFFRFAEPATDWKTTPFTEERWSWGRQLREVENGGHVSKDVAMDLLVPRYHKRSQGQVGEDEDEDLPQPKLAQVYPLDLDSVIRLPRNQQEDVISEYWTQRLLIEKLDGVSKMRKKVL
jgi:hypothetical protein